MKVIAKTGNEDIATVYIGEFNGHQVEFVESVTPPIPRQRKWVIIVSTMFGCPIKCTMCDAGGEFHGKLSKEQIFAQIDYLIRIRFPDNQVPVDKFKIQFARMGEPALNSAVLEVLRELPACYVAPGLMPCLSTVAPKSGINFMRELMGIKKELYPHGNFQLQFSIHTTDANLRDKIIPISKWSFEEIANYGREFWDEGDRKITLNFALAKEYPLDPRILRDYFDPKLFIIKITPINPTYRAQENNLSSFIDPEISNGYKIVDQLISTGYEVIVSIGEIEENKIGSNCGQYIKKHLNSDSNLNNAYSYPYTQIQ